MILEPGIDLKKTLFLALVLIVSSIFSQTCLAQETVSFLPSGHVFAPLIGDPLEPACYIIPDTNFKEYSQNVYTALGASVDLFKLDTADGYRWSLGALGAGHLLLDRWQWASYSVLADDWYWGFYLAESTAVFANRIEWMGMGAHFGDGIGDSDNFVGINDHLYGTGIPYTRSGFQWLLSFEDSHYFRPYVGLGYWTNMTPPGNPPLYLHSGIELHSDTVDFIGSPLRLYFTYDLKVNDEVANVLDQYFELGFQWKWEKDHERSLRLALTYANGNNPYGQFIQQSDNHWGIGLFFDP